LDTRNAKAAVVLLALSCYGWLAVAHHRTERDPIAALGEEAAAFWVLGPSARELEREAGRQAARALERLNDRSQPPAARVNGYEESLRSAEGLLVRGLRVRPSQAWVLAELAAVRWELEPGGPGTAREHTEMIEHAAAMAPTVPKVQLRLGTLLLEMGRTREALSFFRRAVELEPAFARPAIATLRDHGQRALDIVAVLPSTSRVLVALDRAFREDGDEPEFIRIVESGIRRDELALEPSLLAAYADACLRSKQPDRLEATLERMGQAAVDEIEAARLRHRGRARLERGDLDGALEDLGRARELDPDAWIITVDEGAAYEKARRYAAAIEAYRQALLTMARGSASQPARAKVYSRIGRVEQLHGRPSRAYDAFRMALQLDPDDAAATRALASMESAAGLR